MLEKLRAKLTVAAYKHFGRLPDESIRPSLEAQNFNFVSMGDADNPMINVTHPKGGTLHPSRGNPSSGYDPMYGSTVTFDAELYDERWKDFESACAKAYETLS